tara:strand:+ start:122 stop:877 length:756 start_codon:yes stop_codon:yes gene_type:complete
MKKILVFSVITFSLFYILSEFVGDKIIKGVLETNISNVLDRETNIENLKINYRNGDAEIYGLQVKNKIFNGNLLNLDKAYLKLNTSSIFSNNVEIESVVLDGIKLNYYFNIEYTMVNDNVRSLEKTLETGSGKSTSTKYFNIKKLNAKNIVLSVNSEELKINKNILLQNLEFENIGNTVNSKNYKTVLRDFAKQTVKTVKNKILSGNFQNKIKNIDKSAVEEKIKKELDRNKKKIKNKLKNNLNKVLGINE